MRKVFRAVLLWLLLFAVPFQGYAASAMLFCGTSHHRNVGVSPIHVDQHSHGHDKHAKHEGSSAFADQHSSVTDNLDHGNEKNDSHGLSKCSACSNCCVGAVIPPTLPDFSAIQPSGSHLIDFTSVSFVGHIAGRLERPPSIFLA